MKQDNQIVTGTIYKQILIFFFPILIGTFFQQMYNTIDAVIVGNFAGKEALSSVGGSSAIIINLVVGFFTGLTAGCTVMISQYFGGKREDELSDALHTAYAFGIVGGIVLGIAGFLICPYVLVWMKTPDELLSQSALYLRIYFAGLVFVFIYNMGASILRAVGDSKRPLYYLIVSSVVNIVFDLIFVLVFRWGVMGVAVATMMSQAASAILVTMTLIRGTLGMKLDIRRIRFHKRLFGSMIKIGLPSGIQSSTYSLSNVIIQSAINGLGIDTVAAWTSYGKIDVIFWMINGSFGIAAATFVGQNVGAGRYDRVRKGTMTCLLMSATVAMVMSAILLTLGRPLLMMFVKEEAVIETGLRMISKLAPFYAVFTFIEIFSASLRAQGDTLIPTAINLIGICAIRAVWLLIIFRDGTLNQILYCYPVSWLISATAMTGYYFYRRKRRFVPK